MNNCTRIESKKVRKRGLEDVLSPSALSAGTPLIMGSVFLFSSFVKLHTFSWGIALQPRALWIIIVFVAFCWGGITYQPAHPINMLGRTNLNRCTIFFNILCWTQYQNACKYYSLCQRELLLYISTISPHFPGWTRISEYKHSPNQPPSALKLPGTVIYREYR